MTLTPEVAPAQEAVTSSVVARRTTNNAAALVLSAILTKGLLFCWQIFLARKLGVDGYGVYATISALMMIGAAIPEFGMGLIVIRDVASRPQDAGRYLAATLAMQPILAVVGYITLLMIAWLMGYGAGLRGLLALAAASLLIDSLGNMVHNQLIASERMVITAIISIGHTTLLILSGIAIFAANGGLWNLYELIVAIGAVRAIAYWVVLLRLGIKPVFPVTNILARYLLINGAPFALMAFLSMACTHSDKLLATALIGTEGTGQLMASFTIVFGVIELLSTPVLVTVFPLMSRLHNGGQQENFNNLLEKLSFLNVLFSLPLAIYISLLAVPLSGLIFGVSFLGAAVALRIMIWYVVVNMVTNVFSQVLAVQNRQRWLLLVRSIGLVLNILLNLILLPRFGVTGTAMAMLITELAILFLILHSLSLPVEWWRRVIARIWRLGLAAIGLTIITLLFRTAHPILSVSLGLPAYVGLLFLCNAVTEKDRILFHQLVAEVPGSSWIAQLWKR